jgi:hypothetical protein
MVVRLREENASFNTFSTWCETNKGGSALVMMLLVAYLDENPTSKHIVGAEIQTQMVETVLNGFKDQDFKDKFYSMVRAFSFLNMSHVAQSGLSLLFKTKLGFLSKVPLAARCVLGMRPYLLVEHDKRVEKACTPIGSDEITEKMGRIKILWRLGIWRALPVHVDGLHDRWREELASSISDTKLRAVVHKRMGWLVAHPSSSAGIKKPVRLSVDRYKRIVCALIKHRTNMTIPQQTKEETVHKFVGEIL